VPLKAASKHMPARRHAAGAYGRAEDSTAAGSEEQGDPDFLPDAQQAESMEGCLEHAPSNIGRALRAAASRIRCQAKPDLPPAKTSHAQEADSMAGNPQHAPGSNVRYIVIAFMSDAWTLLS